MSRSLLHRCDAARHGSCAATVAWIRGWDGAELLLCTHHSQQHGKRLAAAAFIAVLIDTGDTQ